MRNLILAAVLLTTTTAAGTASAQTTAIEGRVDRLEREMRAVQRKVFPGGAGATVEPQITQQPDANDMGGSPAGTPLADLTQRVSALEGQIQSLTGQLEQEQNHSRQVEDAFSAYKTSTNARLAALESNASSTAGREPTVSDLPASAAIEPPVKPKPKPVAAEPKPAEPKPAGGSRAAQLAAIQRPDTGDKAEDGYTYGYRLWQAKMYPEARKELEAVATTYPKHRRASFAQNLLGRAYLDAGAPSLAAVAFYDNYKKNPNGERAPDSLFYLAKALTALKKSPVEICKVYTELNQLYGDRISDEMKAGVAEGRATNKCK
jgi:TolA-binding protein